MHLSYRCSIESVVGGADDEPSGPFVRISCNEVSVNHPDALQILSAPLWKSAWYRLFAVPKINYHNLMSECDPKGHAAMRSNLASGSSYSSVVNGEAFIDKTIESLEQRPEQRFDGLSQMKEEPFEFRLWLSFLVWDIWGK